MSEFTEIGLSSWLVNKLRCMGVEKMTEIQRKVIPVLLKSFQGNIQDIFACSRTGSGKTLAYILPIVERLIIDPKPYYALILAPTRELAYQIHSVINVLTGKSNSRSGNTVIVKSVLVVGGGNYGMEDEDGQDQGIWFGKPNIIVGTPGRLLDLFTNRNYSDICGQKKLKFEMLVMDEADQLITHGFCQQMKEILDYIDCEDHHRQTLVFSATLSPALEHLQKIISRKNSDNKPAVFNLLPSSEIIKLELATNQELDQRYILCAEYVKLAFLVECLLDVQFKQLIIFCATKKEAKLVHKVLITLGFDGSDFSFSPVLLNSDLKQSLRFAAIDKFKSLKSRVLVTTDLASRGLDIPQVDLVINYNCPKSATIYIHRVGRTCRNPEMSSNMSSTREKKSNKETNKTGKAITFVSQFDVNLLKNIETSIGIKLEKEDLIDEDHVPNILKQVAVAIKDAEIRIEKEKVALDETKIKYYNSKRDKADQKGRKQLKT